MKFEAHDRHYIPDLYMNIEGLFPYKIVAILRDWALELFQNLQHVFLDLGVLICILGLFP